jgi:predicted dehydrogenase
VNELRIGLIGAGKMGSFHMESWERVPCARLVAVADIDADAARRHIARRPIEPFDDHRRLLERADIDAVCVCAPSEHHAPIVLDAIAAGKHVLVEKPIATTLQDGLRMAAAARVAGVKLMVGHVERFNPAVGKLAELISQRRIGRVFRAHATRVGPLPARIRDTGVAIDLATHDLDIMQFVLGLPITSIYAQGSRCVHPTQEDMIACLLRFGEDGPWGLLDVNWLTPEKRRELTVIGEGGMLSASYLTQDVWLTESSGAPTAWSELARIRGDAEGAAVRFALGRIEPLQAELEAFARCVLEDTPTPVSAEEGCRALAAALSVRDSAAHSRPVTLLDASVPAPSPARAERPLAAVA